VDHERVVLAELLRPRGNRGEILARSQTDIPGRLESLKSAQVRLATGEDVAVELETAWNHKGDWVLKLSGVDSINDAERFRSAELWVPLAERAKLPDGEFFQSDLAGCSVVDGATGETLGTVAGFEQYGGPPLMEVILDGRERLIPFVKGIYREVDLERRTIVVDVPEGLLDL
jgi:16S rRNA processing protein RimM